MSLRVNKNALKESIDRISDEKVLQAIQTILDYADVDNSVWENEAFVKKMEKRSRDFKSGRAKSYTWEQTKAAARKKLKELSKKRA